MSKEQKPPTFWRGVGLLLSGSALTIGYSFLALRLALEGYLVSAYATLLFVSLGLVVIMFGVKRFRRFLRYVESQESLETEIARGESQLERARDDPAGPD